MDKIKQQDNAVFSAIAEELQRQKSHIELIASENIVSQSVLRAQGSILTNKYAEGYPGKRYYGGCEFVDKIENIAIDRAKKIFNCNFANVQPHSGSQANQAVMLAMLKPGDAILGMSLAAGGHLTHGARPNLSGKWFNAISYGVEKNTNIIDYEQIKDLAKKHRPKIIIAGGSSYPRIIDFAKFRAIADEFESYLMIDMAHFAGLVATGLYPNPLDFADVVTTTTHKTLRGPRGGMILTNHEEIAKKINAAVFPGLQGGPLMHVIAAKAVAFGEALTDEFKKYSQNVINNAKFLSSALIEKGFDIVTGGTDTHLLLVDLRSKGLTGNISEDSLGRAGLTCNKNVIPFDPENPFVTSGIRLGTPWATTMGFGVDEIKKTGNMIALVLDSLINNPKDNSKKELEISLEVKDLCNQFSIYNY